MNYQKLPEQLHQALLESLKADSQQAPRVHKLLEQEDASLLPDDKGRYKTFDDFFGSTQKNLLSNQKHVYDPISQVIDLQKPRILFVKDIAESFPFRPHSRNDLGIFVKKCLDFGVDLKAQYGISATSLANAVEETYCDEEFDATQFTSKLGERSPYRFNSLILYKSSDVLHEFIAQNTSTTRILGVDFTF